MAQINPYLTFNGKCQEALTFYQQCLGGELELLTVKDSPIAQQWPAEVQEQILHASLKTDSFTMLGTDMVDKSGVVPGNAVSLSLVCDSRQEVEEYFSNLSAGGKITHPLHDFFDGTLGAVVDKYGIPWLLKC